MQHAGRIFIRQSLFYARLYSLSLTCRRHLSQSPSFTSIPAKQREPMREFASVMTRARRLTDSLEKPALDDRSYRVIALPNKLQALLIHDPDTDKASASLNVNVGSFSDEDDMPGMAHAVEHALFMGTEKVCPRRPHKTSLSINCAAMPALQATLRTRTRLTIFLVSSRK